MQAVWSIKQAEQAMEGFALGASRTMLFMRNLSVVSLWRWPEDSAAPTPLTHVRLFHLYSIAERMCPSCLYRTRLMHHLLDLARPGSAV